MKNKQLLTSTLLAALAIPAFARDIDPIHQVPPAPHVDLGEIEQPAEGNTKARVVVQGDGAGRAVIRINGEEIELHEAEGVFEFDLPNIVREMLPTANPIEATFLGVTTEPMTREAADAAGLERATGLQVSFVEEGSPAVQAGLQAGDVLLKLNDQVLINAEQLVVLIRSYDAGEKITLHSLRQGKPLDVEVTLGKAMVAPVGPGGAPLHQPGWRVLRNDPFGPGAAAQDMQQLLQRLELDLEDLQGGLNGGGAMQSQMVKNDGQHTITLKSGADGRHLTIKDKAGAVLYEGLLPEKNVDQHLIEENGLPIDVFNKVQPMLDGDMLNLELNLDGMPKPNPAPEKAQAPRA